MEELGVGPTMVRLVLLNLPLWKVQMYTTVLVMT